MSSVMDELYFPKVKVVSQSAVNVNLGPYLSRFHSNESARQALDTVRTFGLSEEEIAARLGIEPQSIKLYDVQFGKLRAVVPMTIIIGNRPLGGSLEPVGFIPVKPLPDANEWRFDFKYETHDDGSGMNRRDLENYMERGPEELVTRMRFSLTPYVPEGVEFNPSNWYAHFDIVSAKMERGSVEYYDRIKVNASFSTSGDKGLFMDSGGFNASFRRNVLHPSAKYKFKLQAANVFDSRRDEKRSGLLEMRQSPKNLTFNAEIMKRMHSQYLDPEINYEDLVAATVFPNISGKNRKIDKNQTMKAMLKLFEAGNVEKFAGFEWVKFSEYG